jgi:hypothetical protein
MKSKTKIKEENIPLYLDFLGFPTKSEINVEFLMARWNRPRPSVVSMIGHAERSPGVYYTLKDKYGLEDDNFPPWMKHHDTPTSERKKTKSPQQQNNIEKTPPANYHISPDILQTLDKLQQISDTPAKSAKSKVPDVDTRGNPVYRTSDFQRNMEQTASVPASDIGAQQQTSPAQQRIAENIRTSQHQQSIQQQQPPEDALVHSLPEIMSNSVYSNSVILGPDGIILRRKQRDDGSIYYEEDNDTRDIDNVISQTLFREIELQMQALMKKIALNPGIIISHSWAVGKGYYTRDLGDFVNDAVKFLMHHGFGVQLGFFKVQQAMIDRIPAEELNQLLYRE